MVNLRTESFLFFMLTFFLWGASIFLVGFFPVAYETVEQVGYDAESVHGRPTNINGLKLDAPTKKYEQTVLMLIDALRLDFLNYTNMPFTFNNACMHITLEVDIPTVTMPRLKSLTTGTLSTFIDILLNLGQSEQLNDSLIHQLVKRGDIISFAGDRTWTNLFPTQFKRKKPNMDSFFVNDFYEGDKNVTKTVMAELGLTDWSMLILHYLGLDHIGHVEGSASLKIQQKLKEMDDVVQTIYNSKHVNNQLVLVTGDHGMRNGGGHGGSSTEERYVPLSVFKENCTSSNLNKYEYKQIDVVPTLAILLSVDIPKDSIGYLISELLQDLSYEEQLYAYYYNTKHLIHLAKKKIGQAVIENEFQKWYLKAKNAHVDFLSEKRNNDAHSSFNFEQAKLNYKRASQLLSNMLSETRVRFNYELIVIGLSLTAMTTIYVLIFILFTECKVELENFPNKSRVLISFLIAILICTICHFMISNWTSSILKSGLLTLSISAAIYFGISAGKLIMQIILPLRQSMHLVLCVPMPLLACFIFHTFSLASSSFIEEEHQTWYYLGATAIILLFVNKFQTNVFENCCGAKQRINFNMLKTVWEMRCEIKMLLVIALLRKLNQTGDKWKDLVDIGDILNENQNKFWLSCFFAFGLIMLLMQLKNLNKPTEMIAAVIATMAIYCFRGATGTVNLLQSESYNASVMLIIFWLAVGVLAITPYKNMLIKKQNYGYGTKANLIDLLRANLSCFLLISALLHKPHNAILLSAMLFILDRTYKLCESLYTKTHWRNNQSFVLAYKTILTIFIAKMFYFYQGNSNSLATIDLNPGYIGQSSYNPFIVGLFVTLNTYCAHITAFLCLVLHMFSTQARNMPARQEKEQVTNKMLVVTSQQDLQFVISLYTTSTIMPVAAYFFLMVVFRYHLFIYSVFAPKFFYEVYNVFVFYLIFAITNLYFKLFE